MNLSKYFETNINEINLIAEKHRGNHERDVVVSNVYLYLSKKIDEIDEGNIKGYIIRWCSMLKSWNQNRCVNLMEEKKNQHKTFELPFENSSSETLTSDFDNDFKRFLGTLNYMDRCIIRDYYEERSINTIEDIMKFYTVKKSRAFDIKKKISNLEENLYKFIKEKQC